MEVEDLFTDLADGRKLLKLLEIISGILLDFGFNLIEIFAQVKSLENQTVGKCECTG